MSGVAAGAAIGDPARCRYGVGRGSAPVERFYQKVRVDGASGCHLWLGARTAFGHGRLSRGGAWCSAHRFAWELEHGPVAEGLYVLHRCTTPGCVNTRHLFVGTARDGTLLNHSRGRYLSLLPPQAPDNLLPVTNHARCAAARCAGSGADYFQPAPQDRLRRAAARVDERAVLRTWKDGGWTTQAW